MGGKGGSSVYQSPNQAFIDDMMMQMATGSTTSGLLPSPDATGMLIAQQLNGVYDGKTGLITLPDKKTYRYDPASGTVLDGNDKAIDASDPNHSLITNVVERTTASFTDPDSAWSRLGGAFAKKSYNPETGQYEVGSIKQKTGQDYLDEYGGFLDREYKPTDYNQYTYKPYDSYNKQSYNQFGYQAPEVKSLDPVVDSAWDTKYNKMAADTEARGRDARSDVEDFTARQGSSLSSGRKMGMTQDIDRQQEATLGGMRADVESEKAFQKYADSQNVRDKQLDYDWQTQKLHGDESRYGQDFGRDESRYGYEQGRDQYTKQQDTARDESRFGQEWERDEQKYGFEDAQQRGQQKLATVEAIDSTARDRAYQENQGGQQDLMNMLTYFSDLMKTYGGLDSNAVQLAAQQSSGIGSALKGISGIAKMVT